MALKGMDIFKLTPKKNCRDCGFPTCLAFSMKVADGEIEIEKCPHIDSIAYKKHCQVEAPLMQTINIGKGDYAYRLGGETVLFRHEKTFVNRNRFALAFSDTMDDELIEKKINNMNTVQYKRIGEEMKVEVAALKYVRDKEKYLNLIKRVMESGLKVVYMLVCEDVCVMKEALDIVKDENPIVFGANPENYKDMYELVKDRDYVLGLTAETLDALYSLADNVQSLGYNKLLLDVGSKTAKEAFTSAVQIRRTALKEGDRKFGYPSVVFVNELAKGDKYMEVALASVFTKEYGSIIVLDDIDYSRALALFPLRQNLFTDPQRPMRIEPTIYPVNGADSNSPVLVTVNFILTYFIVSGEVERSKVPVWIAIPDTGGYSVLTAWAAGKFTGSIIASFLKESEIEKKTKCRKLIIPGSVSVLKEDIGNQLAGWDIVVGPDEAMNLPKFLEEMDKKYQ